MTKLSQDLDILKMRGGNLRHTEGRKIGKTKFVSYQDYVCKDKPLTLRHGKRESLNYNFDCPTINKQITQNTVLYNQLYSKVKNDPNFLPKIEDSISSSLH